MPPEPWGSLMLKRFAILLAATAACSLGQTTGFRAAVVKVDVTPSTPKQLAGYPARQSTGVHDRIWHRIVALDDGTTRFFLVSSDFCVFSPSLYDETAARLKAEAGVDRLHFWWTLTHTHSAPEIGPHGLPKLMMPERYPHDWDREYTAAVQHSLIDGVKEAAAKLAPARLAVGTGRALANINRRARDPEGRISLGLNPEGPADRQIGLLRIEREDGSLLALVANYAMHGTALGPANRLISGDAPGTVAAYVEEKLGAPMLYINGAAGDMAPIYSVLPNFRAAHITEFNVLLGDRILAANQALPRAVSNVRLRAGEKVVETARRPDFAWDDSLKNYLRIAGEGPGVVRVPVRFLFLNDDTVLWAAPLELFSEIAMHVRNLSPFRNTFYFGYANGWLGYLATRRAFAEGGYEPRTSAFTAQAEDDFTNVVVGYLQGSPGR